MPSMYSTLVYIAEVLYATFSFLFKGPMPPPGDMGMMMHRPMPGYDPMGMRPAVCSFVTFDSFLNDGFE